MNKTAIKNFAIWARKKLIADISFQAGLAGVTETGIANELPQSSGTIKFYDIGTKDPVSISGEKIRMRQRLVDAIREKEQEVGYQEAFRFVVEKVAYTWFNRLIAIRFMEVNDYLSGRTRVLSSENPMKAEPDLVTNPFDADLPFSDQEKKDILRMKDENRLDELFRFLFIRQCHELHKSLPMLFDEEQGIDRKDSYLDLLLTISFTDKDGVLWHLVHEIPEDDFNVEKEGQVEIIGWMYQYYNTEPKDQVFANLKKNIKISKDNIPAATQLFTPDWIVRYMVENSLGRLWVEGHPNEDLKSNWKYYLEEAEQEPEVQARLAEIRKEYATLRPEELRCIDPCSGSGHILVYLFEVLMQIYESQGWTQREAAQSIVQNNLYGLDIDDRAAQLAYFAVMMKARQYDRRFLERGIVPHVYGIQESNCINREQIKLFGRGMSSLEKNNAVNQLNEMLDALWDAKEYGSILSVPELDWDLLRRYTAGIDDNVQITLESVGADDALEAVRGLIDQAQVMAQKHHTVVTNPPYMGANGVADKLSRFIKDNFPDSKSDLFSVFIEKCASFSTANGYYALITQPSVLFLSSFANLRKKLIENKTISSVLHMGRGIFGIDFGSTSFVLRNTTINTYKGCYFRLHERTFQYIDPDDIAKLYIEAKENHEFKYNFGAYKTDQDISQPDEDKNEIEPKESTALKIYYEVNQGRFLIVPGAPIAYWLSDRFVEVFNHSTLLGKVADSKQGIATADNNRFLREWFEVSLESIFFHAISHEQSRNSEKKWYPYNKGGEFRKWYGNDDYVINWYHDGAELKSFKKAVIRNPDYYFRECFSWSLISSGIAAFRYKSTGKIFDVAGMSCFSNQDLLYFLALCNSKITTEVLRVIAPTINYQCGDIANIPVIIDEDSKEEIESLATVCIEQSKQDWNDYEVSWEFQAHPLARYKRSSNSLRDIYQDWETICINRFNAVKHAEERINEIFIRIYGLEDELSNEVKDAHITIRKADCEREIRSLVSYAVGCMLGRYSLDLKGVVFAGGILDITHYTSYSVDQDNCIPITDEPYFEDDIVGRFVDFIRTVYGSETLEENLDFIANALGNKGDTSREIIRNYFLNDFIKDHIRIYQKRPIYWLFDSGKQNGFKALVYMHRWNADTVGNLRVEYLHRMQRVYEKEIERMQDIIDNSKDNREVNQASKRHEKLVKQLKEARDYDAKIAHVALSRVEIDLDDGVKVNYEKVQKGPDGKSLGILAKI